MNDGQNGLIQPSMSSLLSLRQLEQVLAWYVKDMRLSEVCILILIWQVFSPASVVFTGIGVLLSVCILNKFA
jgi:hypothetical protein